MRKWFIIACLIVSAINLAIFFNSRRVVLFAINARAGCFPWSPKVVDYREGMTLCPGQIMRVPVQPGQQI